MFDGQCGRASGFDSGVRCNPQKSECRLPGTCDPRGFDQLCVKPASRGLTVRRSQIPRVRSTRSTILFVQIAFCFGEHFPSIIQIREIAFSQVDWLRSKWIFGNDGLVHSGPAAGLRLCFRAYQRCALILWGNQSTPKTHAAQTSTPRGTPPRSIRPV